MSIVREQIKEEIEPIDLRFTEEELDREVDRLVEFVRREVKESGTEGALVALSGGIDSTATANLAVEALGAEAVHGVLLPKEVNTETNMSDAEQVARDLGISYDVFEIDSIVEEILDTYNGSDGSGDNGEKRWEGRYVGNTSARVRMTLNYLVANHGDKLVVGTSNRAELATGYVTKFGDGGVDCDPLGDLYKQQVRQVAAHLGVEEELVQKTPTGGMVDYGTDEEEFGVDYDTLDAVLALHVDGGVPAGATAHIADTTEEDVEYIVEMHEASKHKRTPPMTPDRRF